MLDKLYEDIGNKIKNWAKWMFIVEAIGAVITGFVFLFGWGLEDGWWALFIIFFGPVVAFVSTWILYAFGQLVEDIHSMCNKEVTASKEQSKAKAKKEQSKTKANQTDITVPQDDSVPQKQCPQCGNRHDFDYPKCPKCKYTYN